MEIARNSVFVCHVSPVGRQMAIELGRQMAIENLASNGFWSTFVDSINVFDFRLSGVQLLKIS